MEKALMKYVEVFGENFPVMLFRSSPDEDIVCMIDDCISKGLPYVPDLDAACDY